MSYQISHPPSSNIASAAIWVADNTTGGGTWYSLAQFIKLLGLTTIPTPTISGEVLTSTGNAIGDYTWEAPTNTYD